MDQGVKIEGEETPLVHCYDQHIVVYTNGMIESILIVQDTVVYIE